MAFAIFNDYIEESTKIYVFRMKKIPQFHLSNCLNTIKIYKKSDILDMQP